MDTLTILAMYGIGAIAVLLLYAALNPNDR